MSNATTHALIGLALLASACGGDPAEIGSARAAVGTGTTYYLSPSGDDNGNGSINQPWATLDWVAPRLRPGDRLLLRGGTYVLGQWAAITVSGTAASPITIAGYPGETATITSSNGDDYTPCDTLAIYGSYLVFDKIAVTSWNAMGAGISIDAGAHDVTVKNSEIYFAPNSGIMLSGSNNLIYRNSIHDNGSVDTQDHGIYVEGGGNTIRSNTVFNNWANGIQLYRGQAGAVARNTVEYNYVYHNGYQSVADGCPDNWLAGIVVGKGHPGALVQNNRVCDNAQFGVAVTDGQTGVTLTRNVTCYNNQGGVILMDAGSGNKLDHHVSFNDQPFALASKPGETSDYDTFYAFGSTPVLRWDWFDTDRTLAAFRSLGGQDAHSSTTRPIFANLPAAGFDSASAAGYNFCTTLLPALCNPLP